MYHCTCLISNLISGFTFSDSPIATIGLPHFHIFNIEIRHYDINPTTLSGSLSNRDARSGFRETDRSEVGKQRDAEF